MEFSLNIFQWIISKYKNGMVMVTTGTTYLDTVTVIMIVKENILSSLPLGRYLLLVSNWRDTHPYVKIEIQFYYFITKRSLGQGNVFTPVCHSVHRGGGLNFSACTGKGVGFPACTGTGKAGGMHPTGMLSCLWIYLSPLLEFVKNHWMEEIPGT